MHKTGATDPPTTYQTVRLARGCHSSPEEGGRLATPAGQLRRWLQGYRSQRAARKAGLMFGQVEVGDGAVL